MDFQNIKPVEDYQFYLDLSFRRASEKGNELRQHRLEGGRMEKSRYIELMKMKTISYTISSKMDVIIKSFPSFDNLPEFYKKMVQLHIDYAQLKRSLGAINWLRNKTVEMFSIYSSKMNKNKEFARINLLKREFFGRVSSLVKQISNDFVFLEECRKVLKDFPVIDSSLKTVAIVGFPNVGKTTLLFKLTGSRAEIKSYPFTTKGINVAYMGEGREKIQLLDVPGTLDRFEKMNNFEKISYLAMRYCANIIIFVIDLTNQYPLEKQLKLYKSLMSELDKELIIYLSKTDIIERDEVEEFKKENRKAIVDIEALGEEIRKV